MNFENERFNELINSYKELTERGLYTSAKWVAEQLSNIPQNQIHTESLTLNNKQEINPENINPNYLLARSLFDLKEYRRASFLLKNQTGNKSRFLQLYSLFLAGEKRKEEEIYETGKMMSQHDVVNRELAEIKNILDPLFNEDKLDGFELFLFGVVLKNLKLKKQALKSLIRSVSYFPLNWSCWLEICDLCDDIETVNSLEFSKDIKQHWIFPFFNSHIHMELNKYDKAFQICKELETKYGENEHLKIEIAKGRYLSGDFEESQKILEEIRQKDPFRIDNMDILSNILFVNQEKAELSHLAHSVMEIDKFRPETCIIIGNYYGLRCEHEKAIIYFKRALELDVNYTSGWILMGHEFIELKNFPNAIQAYRMAIDLNPKDYRAWYGLGHVYEILQLPMYALYYFNQTVKLRPFDSRMWCAMGNCHEMMNETQNAIKCYQRAERNTDPQNIISLRHLAKLFENLTQLENAAYYHKKTLIRLDELNLNDPDKIDSMSFLANYYKERHELEKAEEMCNKILEDSNLEQKGKEEAQALLREIMSIRAQTPINFSNERMTISPSPSTKFDP
ncbi:cell division cycle protein [Anaeramoeba ignava]|uniref:Cell division cycle protein n=1 Tax=Anaeramoeba ignava TaxID=1746090 RepID=A0A9Q0LTI3_ANAIG|nr:cell division cycle protein [Anaeramoeba ignava]